MLFTLKDVPEGYERAAKELLEEKGYGLCVPEGEKDAGEEPVVEISIKLVDEKKISITYTAGKENAAGSAVLAACDKAFVFRALMRLVRELEKRGTKEGFSLEEKVWLDKNGVMLDCSRNSALTVDTIKWYIRFEASLGMNTLMLYTEDTYEVPEYPYFGAYRGRYSTEELKELSAYADQFGVEMIPCIQALAHLKNALRWASMAGMQDTDDILMVGDEKVYQFVEACIRRATEPFSSKRVHLGMDEAWSLGLGRYLHKNGYHPKSEIMASHLERVSQICRKLGLEPMIWSDMYLRMSSQNNEYYDLPLDMDLSGAVKPPADVTLVYWDYYHTDENFYKQYLRMHRQLCDQVIFAGGGWVWNGVSPNLKGAEDTTEAAMSAVKEAGVREAVCTMWQDDGAETPMGAGLTSIVRFAEHGFAKNVSEEALKEEFEFLTGVSWEAYQLLGEFDRPQGSGFYDNPSKYLLYQDALIGLFDEQIKDWDVKTYYEGLRDGLLKALGERPEKEDCAKVLQHGSGDYAREVLSLYVRLADALTVKAPLGRKLYDAYAKKDRQTLMQIAGEEIPLAMEKIRAYRDSREALWNRESRIFGFEVIDIRIGGVLARLESAKKRVEAYGKGEVDSLPELEEPRLPFRPVKEGDAHTLCACNSWKTIVSASPI
ncbi:MAG TPA: beta-N-acetylhexosaminidase [Candidatus Eisenbergiella merdipullorum]|uniref:Beta-N-acetylhexosaminidase n=1 Tax=Candidatus Eisenbergiella merdipullorum TaxID=2838553 RepID=A0A9D2I7G3_9FIRM|nr:beta-N-acetylhexosaminidase [Candidatus Eisenbergiella merdipullorum]